MPFFCYLRALHLYKSTLGLRPVWPPIACGLLVAELSVSQLCKAGIWFVPGAAERLPVRSSSEPCVEVLLLFTHTHTHSLSLSLSLSLKSSLLLEMYTVANRNLFSQCCSLEEVYSALRHVSGIRWACFLQKTCVLVYCGFVLKCFSHLMLFPPTPNIQSKGFSLFEWNAVLKALVFSEWCDYSGHLRVCRSLVS